MEKRVLTLVSLFLIIILISLSFVSANIFSDAWNKITGRVIEGYPICTDSDVNVDYTNGLNFEERGTTIGLTKCGNQENCLTPITWVDRCTNSTRLEEFYCLYDHFAYVYFKDCDVGCSGGACVDFIPSGVSVCSENDGGINYNVRSEVRLSDGRVVEDYCIGNIVGEYYCIGTSSIGHRQYNCSLAGKVCSSGVCR